MLAHAQSHLFCFGLGYSATRLAARLASKGWRVSGTRRSKERALAQSKLGYEMHVFDGNEYNGEEWFSGVTHILVSVPPGRDPKPPGDPVLAHFAGSLVNLPSLNWLGYLSTTGVYGNTDGAWVDETSALNPTVERSVRRAEAESSWQNLARDHNLPLHIFRLAGIYGPNRNVLEQARVGKARPIVKAGHQFSRIHVDDIATILEASIKQPNPGAIYNVCDDEPAASSDVISYAYKLLEIDPPREVDFEEVAPSMSLMGRSFWEDNRRIQNDRMKIELGVRLAYPTYRDGLKVIYDEEFSS